MHLAYLGMGPFVELVEWSKPLEIATKTGKTRSIVIGEVSTLSLRQTIKDGLTVESNKSRGDSVPNEPTPSTSSTQDSVPPSVPDDPTPSSSANKDEKDVKLKS